MTSTLEGEPTVRSRVGGIDRLRFVLAGCVVLNHFGLPPILQKTAEESLAHLAIRVGVGGIFNGPAAVAIFFLISGFCIHYPFRGSLAAPAIARFYARRNLRILGPAAVAIALSSTVGVTLSFFHSSVLWSLLCEEIYYLIYPVLRMIGARIGWEKLLCLAAAGSVVPIALAPTYAYNSDFGWQLTWFVCLPYWLCGCLLAERWDAVRLGPPSSPTRLWTLRVGMAALATTTTALRFHSPIGFNLSLPLVVLVGYFWVAAEARHVSDRGVVRGDRLGLPSYSIYLFHPFAIASLALLSSSFSGTNLGWLLSLVGLFATCVALYGLVERPFHRLSRSLFRLSSAR